MSSIPKPRDVAAPLPLEMCSGGVVKVRSLHRIVFLSLAVLASSAVQAQSQSQCLDRGGTLYECRDPDLGTFSYSTAVAVNHPIGPFASEAELVVAFYAEMNAEWPCGYEVLSIEPQWVLAFANNQFAGYPIQLQKSVSFRAKPIPAGGCNLGDSWVNGATVFYKQRNADANGRWVACPGGFDKWLYSGVPADGPALCGRYQTAGICRPGNPIDPATGAKIDSQTDYVSPTNPLLTVTRHYDSQGFNGAGFAPSTSLRGTRWRAGSDRSIAAFGSSGAFVVTYRGPDGSADYFQQSGLSFLPINPRKGQLTATLDVGGVAQSYRYRSVLGTIETFDANGRLMTLSDSIGRRVNLAYDAAGLLESATDQFGRRIGYSKPSASEQRVTLPDGETIEYDFGIVGEDPNALTVQLRTVRYAGVTIAGYLYGEIANFAGTAGYPQYLTGYVDGNSERTGNYAYSAALAATTTESAAGANRYRVEASTTCTGFDVIDPLGARRTTCLSFVANAFRISSMSQPAGAGCGASSSSQTYDANANVASRVDFANHKTCYAYDLNRNLETGRIEGFTAVDSCPATLSSYVPTASSPQRKIQTRWHPDWRLETRRAEPKKITTSVYNGQPDPTAGNVAASCAPSTSLVDGKPIAVLCKRVEQATTDETGALGFSAVATGTPRIWTYTYNSFGQVLTANGPRTDNPGGKDDLTTYEYYPSTQVDWTMGDLKQVTNALGQVTRFTKYDRNGRLLSMTDANGVVTQMAYTPRGWLKQVTVTPNGPGTAQTSLYEYDGVGQLKKATLPDGSWVSYAYDAAHRLTGMADNVGNSVHYTLDNMGNRKAEDTKDPAGNLVRTVSRVIDALNRVQTVTGAVQ